jgi:hypothetical protein
MDKSHLNEKRRDFLKTLIPVSGMLCISCPALLKSCTLPGHQDKFLKRIQKRSLMTYEQYFGDKYAYYIGFMKQFSEVMGKEAVLSIIKKSVDEVNQSMKPNMMAKSVRGFANTLLDNKTYKICLEMETLEFTDKVFKVRVRQCLWAKTFRDRNAADIGYATMCHSDFSSAAAYNPKLKLERTKTLMEGHDYCNHRFVWSD